MKIQNLFVLFLVAGCATQPIQKPQALQWIPDNGVFNRSPADDDENEKAAEELYLNSIRRAQVWSKPDLDRFDLAKSDYPEAGGPYYNVGDSIQCNYNDTVTREKKKTSGKTSKFWCDQPGDSKPTKIKYFAVRPEDNREVFAGMVTTRLFRALGFMANRVYSVSVNCKGCTIDPWDIDSTDRKLRTTPFSPALVEFKPAGKSILSDDKEGWAWERLDLIDPQLPPAQQAQMKIHRGALKLLAAFVQHSDNKTEQQNLICLEEIQNINGKLVCSKPYMYVHDLGATWGGGGTFTKGDAKMSFHSFIEDCAWSKDSNGKLFPHLKSSFRGTMGEKDLMSISDESRLFLADLLKKFASRPERVRQLFALSQVEKLHQSKNEKVTVDHWVAAFNIKVNEIATKSCFKEQREKLSKAAKAGQPFSISVLN